VSAITDFTSRNRTKRSLFALPLPKMTVTLPKRLVRIVVRRQRFVANKNRLIALSCFAASGLVIITGTFGNIGIGIASILEA
jgi:hypothetical protein